MTFQLEGYNLESGKWTTGNLGKAYEEDDVVPHRLVIDNSGNNSAYVLPATSLQVDHYNSTKNAIFYDATGLYGYVDGAVDTNDPFYPNTGSASWHGITPSALDVPTGGGGFGSAPYLVSTFATGMSVPANTVRVFYMQAHLAVTAEWNYASPARDGAGYYPGSSGQTRIDISGVGQKTVPLPSIPAPTALIEVIKFNDLNGDGELAEGRAGGSEP